MVRRRRVAQAFRFLCLIVTGLALGCTVAECYVWLRTAHFGSPYVFDIYRALGIKLPHSAWLGISKAILWVLVQPVCLIGSMGLTALALLLHMLMRIVQPSDWPAVSRLSRKQILLLAVPPPATGDPVIVQIKQAYRRSDALKELAPSTPPRHDEV